MKRQVMHEQLSLPDHLRASKHEEDQEDLSETPSNVQSGYLQVAFAVRVHIRSNPATGTNRNYTQTAIKLF